MNYEAPKLIDHGNARNVILGACGWGVESFISKADSELLVHRDCNYTLGFCQEWSECVDAGQGGTNYNCQSNSECEVWSA